MQSGGIEQQSRRVFTQMKAALEAADASLDNVALVQVYLVDMADWAAMNSVWNEFFTSADGPERATIGIKELAVAGMLIEIVVTAYV